MRWRRLIVWRTWTAHQQRPFRICPGAGLALQRGLLGAAYRQAGPAGRDRGLGIRTFHNREGGGRTCRRWIYVLGGPLTIDRDHHLGARSHTFMRRYARGRRWGRAGAEDHHQEQRARKQAHEAAGTPVAHAASYNPEGPSHALLHNKRAGALRRRPALKPIGQVASLVLGHERLWHSKPAVRPCDVVVGAHREVVGVVPEVRNDVRGHCIPIARHSGDGCVAARPRCSR